MSEPQRSILKLEGVSKTYGSGELSVTALENVTLSVNGGEIVAIMGPSGSGKTTLLTIAGALLRPTVGSVEVCGIDITKMGESKLAAIRRDKVGFVYQSFNLLAALTAVENVSLVIHKRASNGRTPPTDRALEWLDTLGLSHRANSLPKKMSDGEKQRVAIARALAKDADLILADEPTANLDSKRGHEVMQLLHQKAIELNKGVIVVSHDARIRQFASRILWLEDGTIREHE
ncbi:MAG: ABC transporter ATP-binding protein [Chloroflexi bacterium]|nr:ABC transporter ATP-binding protein [Chloroflexota bacterium]